MKKVVNVEHEIDSDVIWIDRITTEEGKLVINCVPLAKWTNAEEFVKAAEIIARLRF